MIRFNIPLSNASGLCYDGAKNMCGIKNEVFNKFFAENLKVFFTNCFRYALSLAVADMEKNVFWKTLWNATYIMSNLIKKSPKRDVMLQKIWKDLLLEYPAFRVLCSTWCTVKAKSILITGLLYNNFGMNHLMEIWNQKLRVELLL